MDTEKLLELGSVALIDEIVRLKHEQLKLLADLRLYAVTAERAGVPMRDIVQMGYDPALDPRRRRPFAAVIPDEIDAALDGPNYVVLADGRRIDCPPDYAAARNKAYRSWVHAQLYRYKTGDLLFAPDISPAAWKEDLRRQQNPDNRPVGPPGEG